MIKFFSKFIIDFYIKVKKNFLYYYYSFLLYITRRIPLRVFTLRLSGKFDEMPIWFILLVGFFSYQYKLFFFFFYFNILHFCIILFNIVKVFVIYFLNFFLLIFYFLKILLRVFIILKNFIKKFFNNKNIKNLLRLIFLYFLDIYESLKLYIKKDNLYIYLNYKNFNKKKENLYFESKYKKEKKKNYEQLKSEFKNSKF